MTQTAPVVEAGVPQPGSDGRYTISAKGIRAQFIPYGATLTNLWVKDKHDKEVDVVLGWDDAAFYPVDTSHPVYNSIPGRYANRVANGQYTLDGKTYNLEKNDGPNCLHSGTNNWSWRMWEVQNVTDDSVTFTLHDAEGSSKGFAGDVDAKVTYSVKDGRWDIKMEATGSGAKTPLMLTQHTYFNLEAYRNPADATIFSHTLHMPYSPRYIALTPASIPTGELATAAPGSIMDFASEAGITIGRTRDQEGFATNCGTEGYNHYWLFEAVPTVDAVVLTLASPWNGIKADLRTDQPGVQIYSTGWSDGAAPLKSTQGTESVKTVGRSSAVAIEPHDFVDGINHPEWGRTGAQILSPGKTITWEASWTFGLL
ncbi:aldose epimerase-like protein [Plectosphaerella plurivora]|uniref:Aldose epimerase-like protein n=1 Tax=Plectosphaerella plurivora TaxID=936078 RepID=A0A9P8VG35_9PEZI|nr:aldose epimerase-like protein [Plectosphaerella plurivora]